MMEYWKKNISKVLSFIRWSIRKYYWKYFHVDNLDKFEEANLSEKAIWSFFVDLLKSLIDSEKPSISFQDRNVTVLEIGCVNGRNLIKAKLNHPFLETINFKGLDINSKAIRNGKNYIKKLNVSNIELIHSNLMHIELENIDCIISVATLIYLDEFELKRFLEKVLSSDIKMFLFFEPLAINTNHSDTNFYHSLDEFRLLEAKYSKENLKFKNPNWDLIKGVQSKAILFLSKELKNRQSLSQNGSKQEI
jgi:hypothetical protein